MNRRQFNKSLAALAAAPAMPPHMASGIPAPAIPPALYAKASHFARLGGVRETSIRQYSWDTGCTRRGAVCDAVVQRAIRTERRGCRQRAGSFGA